VASEQSLDRHWLDAVAELGEREKRDGRHVERHIVVPSGSRTQPAPA
jgi:hypothetical protein